MPAEMVASQPPSREPASSDRLPVHRSESPTGYSSAGCSPAEPASASPVSDIVAQSRSGQAIKCAAHLTARMQLGPSPAFGFDAVPRSPCPPPAGVSSLFCAPGVISILRGQADIKAICKDRVTVRDLPNHKVTFPSGM